MQVFSEPEPEQNHPRPKEQQLIDRLAASAGSDLPLPRILFVLAHPDDEVIAAGARLERMTRSHLITVTDGAPKSGDDAKHHGFADLAAYRTARQNELIAALENAGLDRAFVLPFPAQVPDQATSHHLAALTCALADVISDLQPEAVLTHPYEGGHPDHDACAFAAHTAVHLLAHRKALEHLPLLVEAPFYNVGDNGSMRTGSFLQPPPGAHAVAPLTAAEARRKRARLACFASQSETLAQFGTESEQFRVAPHYDFTLPPHPGKLLYEHFTWGMEGASFRQLAAAALQQLFPPAASAEASCA